MATRAVLSFLANAPDREVVEVLNRGPEKAAEFLRAEWVVDEKNLDPDSVEAAEDAEVAEKNARGARRTWRRVLSPEQRTTLLAAGRMLGASPADLRASLD